MKKFYLLSGVLMTPMIFSAAVAVSSTPAAAAVACQGDFQKVEGSWIATPYCSDHHIAKFADREYGQHVSTQQVENDPELKDELCDGSVGLVSACGMGGDDAD